MRTGLVASLARGNPTGVTGISPELAGKHLELLRALRRLSRVWRSWRIGDPIHRLFLQEAQDAGALGMSLQPS